MTKSAKNERTFIGGFLSVFGTCLLIALVGLAIALSVVPHFVNGAALTVMSGSMEPTLSPGDMIVVAGVNPTGEDIQVGDIITFMPFPNDPTMVTHRVIGKSISPSDGPLFITQGDANGAADKPVLAKQIRGKFLYSVPFIGYFTNWASGKVPWLATAAGLALIGYALFLIFGSRRRRAKRGIKAAATSTALPNRAATDAAPGKLSQWTAPNTRIAKNSFWIPTVSASGMDRVTDPLASPTTSPIPVTADLLPIGVGT
jgi:signal peptidase